ncbi:MAG: hypothetical protein AABY39_00050, partial [Nitrospirota bacterium]
MKQAPSLAKLTKSKSSNVLLRKRLFKLLDEARNKPVVWITAPPGAGKTTLISTYLEERRLSCLWYQIDSGDGDIASFFHYMAIAAKQAAPRYRKPLPNLTPEYLRGLPTFTRNYFRELYSRVSKSQSIKGSKRSDTLTHGHSDTISRFIIVLDNYQDAPADSQLHEIIQTGLSEIIEGINVIIISRTDPPPAFAVLRANNKMGTLGWNELKLSTEEISGIVQLKAHKKLSKEAIQELHEKTNGWAAGLALMLEHQGSADMLQRHGRGFTTQAMFDYFASEIFYRLDNPSQEILLQTAFLPIMTGHFAQQLTGLHQAGELLSELNRRNYFTIRKSLPDPVYQYHPLFREFLLAQAKQQLTDAQLIQTQHKAAEILESTGQAEDAIILYSHAEDWASMARIILANAQAMITEGRNQAVEQWINRLPQAVINEVPWLLYWLGVCRMPFNLPEGRGYFEQAFEKFKLLNNAAGIFLAWAGVVETYIYQWGDFKPLDKWISEIEALLAKYPTLPSPEIEAKVTTGVFTALAYRQPQHPDLPVWAERLQRLIEINPDASSSMIMGNQLLLYYSWWNGDLVKGTNLVNILEPLSRLPDLAPISRITWQAIKAVYSWMAADDRGCIQAVEEGLRIAETTGVHILDFMLLAQGAWGVLTSGEPEKASLMFKQMLLIMDNSRLLDVCQYRYQAFIEAMHRNDIRQMEEHAEAALCLAREAGVIWAEGTVLPASAWVYFASGKHDMAVGIIKQTMQIAQDIRSKTIEINALQAEVEFAMAQENEAACLKALQKIFTLCRQQGYINAGWWRSSIMSRACAIALENNIEKDYIKFLIKKRSLLPPDDAVNLENWPWPVRIYALGRFAIVKDSKPMRFTEKAKHTPLKLLKVIIALGGRDIGAEVVIDTLWPDADGDTGLRSLNTTLHRLRKLLGNDMAISLEDNRLTIDVRHVWVDVFAFQRLLGKIENTLKKPDLPVG